MLYGFYVAFMLLINKKYHALILLCSLPNSYENIIYTMLYGRKTTNVNEMNDVMLSKILNHRVYGNKEGSS